MKKAAILLTVATGLVSGCQRTDAPSTVDMYLRARTKNQTGFLLYGKRVAAVVVTALLCLAATPSWGEEADTFRKVNFAIDFTDYEQGSVEKWLEAKGFTSKRGARDRTKLDLDVGENGLILEAKKRVMGLIFNEGVDLEEFSSVRMEWGILSYPEDASYAQKVNNEALMLYVFFGYDKISSGHFAIPNSPYFIGMFLGKDDKVNQPYLGRFYHKGGRFVCLGNPEPGETVVSEFDLITHFKAFYEKDEIPVISGISLGVDTTRSAGGGKAAAFIKSIEFLE